MNTTLLRRSCRILVLNPNSSHDMTHGIEVAIRRMQLPDSLEIYTYTAPADSPASINDDKDLKESADAVFSDVAFNQKLGEYDAILIACFSVHPLVKVLSEFLGGDVLVSGIFEASILTSLTLLPPYPPDKPPPQTWGIVTTGKFWEEHLSEGVRAFLGQQAASSNAKFAGVYSTGLSAGDFHGGVPHDVIHRKLKEAAKKLLAESTVGCVVMGCAGMVGLEDIIRTAAVEEYGEGRGNRVYIIDGVKAGVRLLEQTIKNKREFES